MAFANATFRTSVFHLPWKRSHCLLIIYTSYISRQKSSRFDPKPQASCILVAILLLLTKDIQQNLEIYFSVILRSTYCWFRGGFETVRVHVARFYGGFIPFRKRLSVWVQSPWKRCRSLTSTHSLTPSAIHTTLCVCLSQMLLLHWSKCGNNQSPNTRLCGLPSHLLSAGAACLIVLISFLTLFFRLPANVSVRRPFCLGFTCNRTFAFSSKEAETIQIFLFPW